MGGEGLDCFVRVIVMDALDLASPLLDPFFHDVHNVERHLVSVWRGIWRHGSF